MPPQILVDSETVGPTLDSIVAPAEQIMDNSCVGSPHQTIVLLGSWQSSRYIHDPASGIVRCHGRTEVGSDGSMEIDS